MRCASGTTHVSADSSSSASSQAGTVIVQQGEPLTQDSKFYIVEQGQLECHRRATHGDRHVVKRLDKGTWFGELALLTKAPRQADVTTTTRVKVRW